ncbi:MAG: GNAT family N-acetyltransferase [Mobilicoccus sp.]|nr:GNAT family N-acetyltransferase [Mobilicoccus sp.]
MHTMDAADLLLAYDDQLRGRPEFAGAEHVRRDGPVWTGRFGDANGFISHDPTWTPADPAEVAVGVDDAVGRLGPDVHEIEWKTRGHDPVIALLHEALLARGFVPDEAESVMIGRTADLAGDVPLPDGVTLRRIATADDVHAMAAMQADAFGAARPHAADALGRRLAAGEDLAIWVAEHAGHVICAGRIEPVPGTEFAGIWGGATEKAWRGRGIYRALTAARARWALARDVTFLQSDSTEASRPILERSGMVRVTTTTPYMWRRGT